MKMSKAERKAYNSGKRAGYADGYLKGLHDGNPFNMIADALRKMGDAIKSPEFLEALKAAKEAGDFGEWIGSGDNDNYCYCSECNYGDTRGVECNKEVKVFIDGEKIYPQEANNAIN